MEHKELFVFSDNTLVVHYHVNNGPLSLRQYKNMAKALRKSFPEARSGEIMCCEIRESEQFKGHALVRWHTIVTKAFICPKGWNLNMVPWDRKSVPWAYSF